MAGEKDSGGAAEPEVSIADSISDWEAAARDRVGALVAAIRASRRNWRTRRP